MIVEVIPIVLFYLFLVYPDPLLKFSITPLGRFAAVCLILYYTVENMWYGLVMCIFIVFYYQMDLVEGFETGPVDASAFPKFSLISEAPYPASYRNTVTPTFTLLDAQELVSWPKIQKKWI